MPKKAEEVLKEAYGLGWIDEEQVKKASSREGACFFAVDSFHFTLPILFGSCAVG